MLASSVVDWSPQVSATAYYCLGEARRAVGATARGRVRVDGCGGWKEEIEEGAGKTCSLLVVNLVLRDTEWKRFE